MADETTPETDPNVPEPRPLDDIPENRNTKPGKFTPEEGAIARDATMNNEPEAGKQSLSSGQVATIDKSARG